MTDDKLDRAPTDEPDGTTPYAASLRSPGASAQPGGSPEASDDDIAGDPAPAGDDPLLESGNTATGAGYDAEAVSGDTDVYRPDR